VDQLRRPNYAAVFDGNMALSIKKHISDPRARSVFLDVSVIYLGGKKKKQSERI
jgi:hypothetical protein